MKYIAIFILILFYLFDVRGQLPDNVPETPIPYCQNRHLLPVGGGPGYESIIDPNSADVIISNSTTPEEFVAILTNASSGDIIYMRNNVKMDLTGKSNIELKEGVTLASGRGINQNGNDLGAIISTRDFSVHSYERDKDYNRERKAPLFKIQSTKVRITGIRFIGPSNDRCPSLDCLQFEHHMQINNCLLCIRLKSAIVIDTQNGKFERVEVDNCEFTAWPQAAVSVHSDYVISDKLLDDIRVHHNYMYENLQERFGYGTVISHGGYAKIYSNLYRRNRHDIAGDGRPTSGYEAFCNTCLPGSTHQNFDMHANPNTEKEMGAEAGTFIHIHHNYFLDKGDRGLFRSEYNMLIRAVPEVECRIENNVFANSSVAKVIKQRDDSNDTGPQGDRYGHMIILNNVYDHDKYLGWYVHKDWLPKHHYKNICLVASSGDDMMSPLDNSERDQTTVSMNSPVYLRNKIIDYAFGDFDGDGKTEILKTMNGFWYTLPLDASPFNTWKKVKKSEIELNNLHFGYFDANLTSDVFRTNGREWYVSASATSSWEKTQTSNASREDLFYGDFGNNNIHDIFWVHSGKWLLSKDGSQGWDQINSSSYSKKTLWAADFTGDEKHDIMTFKRNRYKISVGATNRWANLSGPRHIFSSNSGFNPHLASSYNLGDFDHNGRVDMIIKAQGRYYISKDGHRDWVRWDTQFLSFEDNAYFNQWTYTPPTHVRSIFSNETLKVNRARQ